MKRFLNLLIFLLAATIIKAQEMPQIIPPSPEAASMLSYGNTGVSFYTGQPNFSVPIHTISVKGFQFPISLSYSGFQGINLESVAPWVGLGWSLNATGTVSRTIRTRADDELMGQGYLILPEPDFTDTTILFTEFIKYGDKENDGEPDKFYFSVNGLNGSFFFRKTDANGISVVQKTQSNVKIQHTNTRPISDFTITDTNGYIYYFNEQEHTRSAPNGNLTADIPDPVTSWYLKNIISPAGDTLLSFNYYTLNNLQYTTLSGGSEKIGELPFLDSDLSHTTHYTTAKRLKEIVYDGG